jgi:hypothetical protein
MKTFKILLLWVALCFASLVSNAQVPMLATIPSSTGLGPSGAVTATSPGITPVYLYVQPKNMYRVASFGVKATRVSTGMNGSAFLQGSVDGINYFALSTTDSIHISNAATDAGDKAIVLTTSSTAYPSNGLPYPYYRLKFVQIAGDTATVQAWFYGRQ